MCWNSLLPKETSTDTRRPFTSSNSQDEHESRCWTSCFENTFNLDTRRKAGLPKYQKSDGTFIRVGRLNYLLRRYPYQLE